MPKDLLIVVAFQRQSVRAHLAHSDSVSPAASYEPEQLYLVIAVVFALYHKQRIAQAESVSNLVRSGQINRLMTTDDFQIRYPVGIAGLFRLNIDQIADIDL